MLSGLLLGGMRAGAQSMQISPGVPAELVDALQAIILLFLLINVLRRWRASRAAGGSASAPVDPTDLAPAFVAVAK
jgi:ABC-type uncharacterized transport system permease subunit